MPIAVAKDLSFPRRAAALASMLGASATVAVLSIHSWRIEWLGVLWAAMLAAGGLGITAKNLTAQTLSRGMAWLMAVPSGLALAAALLDSRRLDGTAALFFATSASALLLARPQLHTKDAHEQFHPFRFRKMLLAGSTATAATAFLTGGIALSEWGHGLLNTASLGFGLLTVALLAASTAVVRMRAWGILLSGVTSAVLVALGMLMHNGEGFALALLSLPMLLLHVLPILWARWGAAGTGHAPGPRVAASATALESAPVRYRVAALDDELADAELEPREECKMHA